MVHKKLKEIYPVDTISQNKGWVKITAALQGESDDIEIDFTGINVIDPWDCPDFVSLMQDKRIHMVFRNKKDLVNRIKMMCVINGAYPDHVVNIEVEKPKEKSAEEKKIENIGSEIATKFKPSEEDEGTYIFDVKTKYTQMHSTNTLNYIQFAMDKLNRENGTEHFIVKLGSVSVLDNVLEVFADMIMKYKAKGIRLEVDVDNEEVQKKMGLYLHKSTAKAYSIEERIDCIQKAIEPGTPGILIKYKKSRTLDDFGRYGKGEVISSRIAIYRGIKGKQSKTSEPVVMIESYNNDYFFTRQHWMVEHDNEQLQGLHMDRLEIGLEELGFGDDFLGNSYHFLEPVPEDNQDSTFVITDIDSGGKNVIRKCTLPERMKLVFDDWGIEYDQDAMEMYIEDTRDILRGQA